MLVFFALISGGGYIISCTHENLTPPEPAPSGLVITHGTNVHLPGNMVVGDSTQWKVDKPGIQLKPRITHSVRPGTRSRQRN